MKNTKQPESLPATQPRFMRPADAGMYLSLSRPTIYNLLAAGKLKSHLVGGCRLLDREELDRFVLSH